MKRWHEETAKAKRNQRHEYAKDLPLGRWRKNRSGSCNCSMCSHTKKAATGRRLATVQELRVTGEMQKMMRNYGEWL